jgi:hypothetical protein
MIEFQSKLLKFIIKIFPFSGSLMLLVSLIGIIENCQFIVAGSRIQGDIISISGGKHKTIQFLPAGKTKIISADGSDSSADYKVGSRMTVLCLNKVNYKSSLVCRVDTPGSLWYETVLMGIGGAIHLRIAFLLRASVER